MKVSFDKHNYFNQLDQWFALEKQKFEAQFDTYWYLH